jgi:hypothetical protein
MIKKIKKRIKRRPGKSGHMYFSDETQEAIIEFQGQEEEKKRNEVYVTRIHPAFDSLVENLIMIYGFTSPGESVEETKSDCISFLYSSLNKWSPDKGTRAFSYFNVVAKNFLIANTRKSIKRNNRHVSIDQELGNDIVSLNQSSDVESYSVAPSPDDVLIEKNRRNEIMEVLLEIENVVEAEHEQACIKAIISIFEKIDDLDFLNKRAIRVYVRDISGLTSKKLSSAMTSIKAHYREISRELEDLF